MASFPSSSAGSVPKRGESKEFSRIDASIDSLGTQITRILQIEENPSSGDVQESGLATGLKKSQEESPFDLMIKSIFPNGVPEPMSPDEAFEFVTKCLGFSNQSAQSVRKLVATLKFHPVPIKMAVAFIRKELRDEVAPIMPYLDLLEYEECSVPGEFTEIEKITVKAWNLILKSFIFEDEGLGSIATLILVITSFYASENIPACLFTEGEEFSDRNKLNAAIAKLKKYSIITGTAEAINVHPLIRQMFRAVLTSTPALYQGLLERNLNLFERYLTQSEGNLDVNLNRSVGLHAESIWKYALKSDKLLVQSVIFPLLLAENQKSHGRYEEMVEIIQDYLSGYYRIQGRAPQLNMNLRYYEAVALHKLNKHSDSLKVLQDLMEEAMSKPRMEYHKMVLLEFMAEVLEAQGNQEERLRVFQDIVAIQSAMYGPEDKTTLSTLYQTGCTLVLLGRRQESLKIFHDVYVAQRRTLGDNHESTLQTKASINNNMMKN